MADQFGRYEILIDGRWSLEDLYVFPRAFEQVYFALGALVPAEDDETEDRIVRAFRSFPWGGGYSAVGFYNLLKYSTPPSERPTITSIQYASPGWIEIFLHLPLAVQIGASVTSAAATIRTCNSVYNKIQTDLQNRKLLRIEVERKRLVLTREEIQLVREGADEMAKIIVLESAKALHDRTDDPLISLKILLSVYRRIRTLAEYKNKGKVDFLLPKNELFDDFNT